MENGDIEPLNRAATDLLGYRPEEFRSLKIFDIDVNVRAEGWKGLWRKVKRTKHRNTFETSFRHRDGHLVPFEVSTAFVEFEGNGYIVGSARDITNRVVRRKALIEAETRLRDIVNGLPVAVMVTRVCDHVIADANPLACRTLGAGRDQLLGRSIIEFYTDPGQRQELLNRLMRDGEVDGFEIELKSLDGGKIWMRASVRRLLFEGEDSTLAALYDITAERQAREHVKRIEDNLRQSDERYALAMEASREGLYDLDLASGALFVSSRISAIFGIPSERLKTAGDWLGRIVPEDRRVYRDSTIAHFRGLTDSINCDYRIYDLAGNIRWIRERSVCRRNADGQATRLVGSVGDVTELKEAEKALEDARETLERRVLERTEMLRQTTEALRQREERLDGIMKTVVDGIITLTEDGTIESANPAAERIFGYAASEIVGRNITVLMPEPMRALHLQRFHGRELKKPSILSAPSGEIQGQRKDGTIIPVEIAVSELHLGERRLYTGIVRDIRERKAAEEALRESEQRYRSIFEQAVEGIYQTTPTGRFLEASPSLARLFGYDSPEELLTNVVDVGAQIYLNSEDRVRFRALLEANGEVRGFECQLLTRQGQVIWVSINSRAVRDAQGAIVYYEGTIEDISERKEAERAIAEQSALLEATLDNISQAVAIFDIDQRLLDCNRIFGRLLDLPLNLVQPGSTMMAVLSHMRERGDSIGKDDPDWRVAQGSDPLESRVDRILADGSAVQVAVKRLPDGRVIFTYTDVTDLKRREAALRQSEERYALAAQGANDGLWDWDLRTNRIYFSPRWKSMLGCREEEIGTTPKDWFTRVHADDLDALRGAIDAHLEGGSANLEHEYRVRHNDGRYLWVLSRGASVVDPATLRPIRLAGSQTDISDRKRVEQQLLHDAFHDGLTGLPNRALFVDRLGQALTRYKRDTSRNFAVMFLDIDRFKYVNDSLGHSTGDGLIITIARRMDACRRASDTVARLGGDEFAVLLEDIGDSDRVLDIAQRFRAAMGKPVHLMGQEIFPTASIGIAFANVDYERPEEMLIDADLAMYQAKSQGRDRYEVFQPDMRNHSVKQLELGADLRRAFDRKEMVLFYQPIVDLASGAVSGFEALVRWQHGQRGLVMPGEFIPVAEETGLIVPLGWWVLEEASRKLNSWCAEIPAAGDLFMSINISARQFKEPTLIERIEGLLDGLSVRRRSLKLEITESLLMDNPEGATDWLTRLKELDLSLSIDDFGTGYSSLSYLHRFPFDVLKIDRSFVSTMRLRHQNQVIVRAIIWLAQTLGMTVVAEGVETAEELALLRELGCNYAQGYYFSRPVPEAEALALLDRPQAW
ncbi:MAG: PAS domain S-box protein [Rhodospirillales bacterium]|nr:PAS domain S-box protein [Rhodospirillales bacterium]